MPETTTKSRRRFATVLSTLVLLIVGTVGTVWAAEKDQSDIEKRIDNARKVLDEVMATPDKAIPDKILGSAKCIAVIPSMVKIAVGFGGNHGKGIATCRTASGRWSALAPITITGGSWGLQLGGQAIDLVMIVTNQDGMEHLLSSKFKIGADASAAAGPVGRDAGADTDWKMKAQMLTYSRARGLFAGIDLSGSVVTQDKDETHLMYGKFVPFGEILKGRVRTADESRLFLSTLAKYAPSSNAQGTSLVAQKTTHNSPARARTVTGCLQADTDMGEFTITNSDGKNWALHSKTVKFDPHVGQQVTITGSSVRKTSGASDGTVHEASSQEKYGELNVTTLKVLSSTCGN